MKKQNKSSEWLNNIKTEWLVNGTTLKITVNAAKPLPANNGDALLVLATANQNHPMNLYDMHSLLYQTGKTATVILAPMYGGIWTLCISLTGTFGYSNYIITHNTLKLTKRRAGQNGAT